LLLPAGSALSSSIAWLASLIDKSAGTFKPNFSCSHLARSSCSRSAMLLMARTWLTVAAYNVGFGHLEDARIIAQGLGKNPDSWTDVRQALPLLAQEKWFLRAKRGYARGWEPVQFVDRVQRFLTLLEWRPGEAVVDQGTMLTSNPPTATWGH